MQPIPKMTREDFERRANAMADLLKTELPEGTGFILGLFDHGTGNTTGFVSTTSRETTIRLLRELVARIEERTN